MMERPERLQRFGRPILACTASPWPMQASPVLVPALDVLDGTCKYWIQAGGGCAQGGGAQPSTAAGERRLQPVTVLHRGWPGLPPCPPFETFNRADGFQTENNSMNKCLGHPPSLPFSSCLVFPFTPGGPASTCRRSAHASQTHSSSVRVGLPSRGVGRGPRKKRPPRTAHRPQHQNQMLKCWGAKESRGAGSEV